MPRKTRTKKKEKKNISSGVVHIQSTFNNTIVTITDQGGNVVAWSSRASMVSRDLGRVRLLPLN